tara:strand:- start:12314 stop:12628 length:315 start_codon:yes stop_codon:yes gene_type:complete
MHRAGIKGTCGHGFRLLFLSRKIRVGFIIEFRFTAGGAEVPGLSGVLTAMLRGIWVHGHSADRILYPVFPLISGSTLWLVVLVLVVVLTHYVLLVYQSANRQRR